MTDKAQVYLNALQTGYRIEEYSFVSDGSFSTVEFIPFNGNRIFLYVSQEAVENVKLYLVLQSGLLVAIADFRYTAKLQTTMAHDYSMPTFEYRVNSNGVGGARVNGFGIIKQ